MDDLLQACSELFGRSSLPFAVCEILLDDNGEPLEAVIVYLNPAMAQTTNHQPEDIVGRGVYEMWGGDTAWLENFYEAAMHGTPIEFETANELLEQFNHVTVVPIKPGYCGFFVQDVSEWVSPVHPSMSKADTGLFFYDMRTHRVMLTPSAQKISGMDLGYTSLVDFVSEAFGPEGAKAIREQVANFRNHRGGVYVEGQLADGRWLRFSLDHAGKTDRFAFGFLEDFTRTKEAELASARYFDIVDSLSRENFALYLADLDANGIEPFRLRDTDGGAIEGAPLKCHRYSEAMQDYVDTYVVEADRERVAAEVSREAVLERLRAGDDELSLNYRRLVNGVEEYVELRMIRLRDEGAKFVLAARNTTAEMHESLRQRAALQSALELAEHASSAKSTFLTNMSHDFRTPMNSISGFAKIALDHLEDTERVRDCLHKIMMSSDHLLNLVNDILDVSRIESGKLSLAEEPIKLPDLMQDVEQMFSEKARERGLDFTVDVGEMPHTRVVSDKLRLNQILVNIIGNAIKFTSPGGMVGVTLRELPDAPRDFGTYVLTVRDTGCGMSADFIERLFDPFERDGLGYTNKTEGTGLGMTITKSLVDLLGGTIQVESVVGRGSEFTVRLPLRLAEAPTPDSAKQASEEAPAVRDFTGCHVLVVDDDDLSREILVEILKDYGFTSDEARDGDAAVRKVEAAEPFFYDAVLMDMRMPRMDGDEATRAIRLLDRPDAATLPIIAETADAFEEGYRRAREAGMTALTTKPLNTHKLIELLSEHIPEK